MKIEKLLLCFVFVIMNFSFWLPASSATLQIRVIGHDPIEASIYEPYTIWIVIYNPDNVSHFYRLYVAFTESSFTENGYIGPKEEAYVYFTAIPEWLGNQSIMARLYQDGGKDSIDEKTETVIVTTTHSTYEYMLGKIQILENKIDETKRTITILSIVIVIQIFLILGIAWLSYRKFGVTDERIRGIRRKLQVSEKRQDN